MATAAMPDLQPAREAISGCLRISRKSPAWDDGFIVFRGIPAWTACDNAVTIGPKRFVAVLGPSRRSIRVTARLAGKYPPPYDVGPDGGPTAESGPHVGYRRPDRAGAAA